MPFDRNRASPFLARPDPEQLPLFPLAVKGFKRWLRGFLTDVLPDPPDTLSAEEQRQKFTISTVGDNLVLGPFPFSVEVLELFFVMQGGSNTVLVKAGERVLWPATSYPNQAFQSFPPFELNADQGLVLNLTSTNSVNGVVRYRIVSPLGARIGGPR